MPDFRPVGYVIGLACAALGAAMLVPMAADLTQPDGGAWPAFGLGAVLSAFVGGITALACRSGVREGLTVQQTFLLTTGVWVALPLFGALPFAFGLGLRPVDAVFEAMSGLTTTGATVLAELHDKSPGTLLWRGLLQWIGGVGIIVVAMAFLPQLRVGGMQIFQTGGVDSFNRILPRATQIWARVSVVYVCLTALCAIGYRVSGMEPFDAAVHAFTTVATGGFANSDASFGAFGAGPQYVAAAFMALAALPFALFAAMAAGGLRPLLRDPQARGFAATVAVLALALLAWRALHQGGLTEETFRSTLFNTVSILTGTGYASEDYTQWGSFAVTALFFAGLIGGCAGSTSCSIKIFRYQLLFTSVRAQLLRIYSPHGVFTPRYQGRPVDDDVLNSVISFFVFFVATLGIVAAALGLTGLDFTTSVSGAAAALANIGPGLGDVIGPAGSYESLNDAAKWILAASMLIGRLELLAVYAIFMRSFWRA